MPNLKLSNKIVMKMIPIARPDLGHEELMAIKEVIESGTLVQGEKVALFEKEFSRYLDAKSGIAVGSGTAALHLALLSHGISIGKEVIIPPITFFSTASTLLMSNSTPIFTDIDEVTYTLDPEKAENALTPETAAIIPVQIFGQSADMDRFMEIAQEKDLKIIEDAAQAHGATYKGKKVGTLGDTACFSFYATKIMTTGEGGMIVTNDNEVAETCKLLRDHGQTSKYQHEVLGYNYRMTEIAAAIGLVQLKKLDKLVKKRRENAAILSNGLKELDHSYYQYIIRLKQDFPRSREELMGLLEKNGIASRPSYPKPLYSQKALKGKVKVHACKVAEEILPQLLELPIHPLVPREALDTIIDTVITASRK